MDGLRHVDVTDLLPSVEAPTLVLQRERRGLEVARRMAAAIPRAQLVLFEGGSAAPYLTDADEIWQVLAEFIGAPGAHPLTTREIDVLGLIAAGKSNRQIAEDLVISLNTVERHVSNVFVKIGVSNRTEAAGYARDHKLLDS
jgi:ATP/maltotriose-dependent transcriptional regulator MalT